MAKKVYMVAARWDEFYQHMMIFGIYDTEEAAHEYAATAPILSGYDKSDIVVIAVPTNQEFLVNNFD